MSLPRIAVDAMGGDEGVRVMVSGAALARRQHDRFKFLLVGDEVRIKAALDSHPNMRSASEILHCEDVVAGDEKPSRSDAFGLVRACDLGKIHAGALVNSAAAEALTSILIFINKTYAVDGAGVQITGTLTEPES